MLAAFTLAVGVVLGAGIVLLRDAVELARRDVTRRRKVRV